MTQTNSFGPGGGAPSFRRKETRPAFSLYDPSAERYYSQEDYARLMLREAKAAQAIKIAAAAQGRPLTSAEKADVLRREYAIENLKAEAQIAQGAKRTFRWGPTLKAPRSDFTYRGRIGYRPIGYAKTFRVDSPDRVEALTAKYLLDRGEILGGWAREPSATAFRESQRPRRAAQATPQKPTSEPTEAEKQAEFEEWVRRNS